MVRPARGNRCLRWPRVLDWDEAPRHPHNAARGAFTAAGGILEPSPAPRFSRTPAGAPMRAKELDAAQTLRRWGVDGDLVAQLCAPED